MKINSTKSRNVHELLKQTVIQGDSMASWLMGDGEKMAKQLRPLCDYLHANAPEKLYRIRQFNENSIEALKQDRLYFTRADWFNDPYDCLLYFEPSRVKVEIEKTISVENLKKAFSANVTALCLSIRKCIKRASKSA